ncbi:MAG: response regulator [Clostridia bacterium]|nr:response regulator [Clostridia bacterium]
MRHKILIADDATFMRMMLKDILSHAGFINLIEAKNGREAINLFKVKKPELILLDVTMPDMDGLRALEEIKEINPDVKIIMCSSMGQEEIVSECFEKGADDFIMKPFKPERVVQAVSQFIDLNS